MNTTDFYKFFRLIVTMAACVWLLVRVLLILTFLLVGFFALLVVDAVVAWVRDNVGRS